MSAKFYFDLAEWWPLFSPPIHYVEEVDDLLRRLAPLPAPGTATLLELGCGGGSFASHLATQFRLTLTDVSEGMLSQSRTLNPDAEHAVGDMRTLRLNREFDYVLVHDAVCYMTELADLRAAIQTATVHCRSGGTVIFLPDYVSESFAPGTDHGGEDAPDGRGLRYLEWRWDPDPAENTYLVDYAFLLRGADGAVRAVHDRHVEGLFPRATWLGLLEDAGLNASNSQDDWGRDVFLARRR